MRIGILGGTFNPIHNGHLIIAESSRVNLNLDKVIFIPLGVAPHKDNEKILDSKERLETVDLAIKSNSYFELSSMEIDRGGTTYTIDTIKALRLIYPDDDIYFIIGGDSLFHIENWKGFYELIELCNFAVLGRCKKGEEEFYRKVNELKSNYDIDLSVVKSPIVEISSTLIRNNLRANKSIKYLVPRIVEEYLINNKSYI